MKLRTRNMTLVEHFEFVVNSIQNKDFEVKETPPKKYVENATLGVIAIVKAQYRLK